jgi:hypothetical protein
MRVGSAQPLELGDGRIKIQRRSSRGGIEELNKGIE